MEIQKYFSTCNPARMDPQENSAAVAAGWTLLKLFRIMGSRKQKEYLKNLSS
jgi:hypothetical protein